MLETILRSVLLGQRVVVLEPTAVETHGWGGPDPGREKLEVGQELVLKKIEVLPGGEDGRVGGEIRVELDPADPPNDFTGEGTWNRVIYFRHLEDLTRTFSAVALLERAQSWNRA